MSWVCLSCNEMAAVKRGLRTRLLSQNCCVRFLRQEHRALPQAGTLRRHRNFCSSDLAGCLLLFMGHVAPYPRGVREMDADRISSHA